VFEMTDINLSTHYAAYSVNNHFNFLEK